MQENENELSQSSQGSNEMSAGQGAAEAAIPPLTARGWLWSWRYFFWLLGLGLLVLLFYAAENRRGRWLWERYQHQLKLQGVPTTIASFVPPPVPDAENFAATPLLASLFDFVPGTQRWREINPRIDARDLSFSYDEAVSHVRHQRGPPQNSWVTSPTDLLAWYDAFLDRKDRAVGSSNAVTREAAATEVLGTLAESDPLFQELRVASRRPSSRFNLRYEEENPAGILLPHLAILKRACAILQLRAAAELALRQTSRAADDVNLVLDLANTCREEPILISHLVRMAELQMALQPLAEGIRQWSEPQLQSFQDRLSRFDFCADIKRTLEAERLFFGGGVIDFVRRAPSRIEMLSRLGNGDGGQSSGDDFAGVLWIVAPKGWFYLERINYSRAFDSIVLPPIDLAKRRISPSECNRSDERVQKFLNHSPLTLFLRHRYFSRMLLPSLARVYQKVAFAQTGVDLATLACALQRCQLAQGHLPEALDSLAPDFIAKVPRDIINGQPLRYRRISPDRYLLYSVGWNETDESGAMDPAAGQTVKGPKNTESIDQRDGDWVWRPLESE